MTMTVRCARCGAAHRPGAAVDACIACGGLLVVEHGVDARGADLRARFDRSTDPSGVWRFGDVVLPGDAPAVSWPEGNTPLLARARISEWCGDVDLRLKHEGHNPSGSFKDRGMTVAITHAAREGAGAVACASTGNTSASMAMYAAQAGIPALVFLPEGKIAPGKLAQAVAMGAQVLMIDGDFDAALALARQASSELGIHLLNSVNPFRLEGQKTIVLELLRELDWAPPDWIALPAGNLGNVSAFGKALAEAREWGLIDRMPRLLAVQARGAAPFAEAFARGFDRLEPVRAETVASAIRIGNPASYERAVAAIRATGGHVLAVDDGQLLDAKAVIDTAGVGCEPASAASVAGVRSAVASGIVAPGSSVVAVLTGHLLKDPVVGDLTGRLAPRRIEARVAAVAAALRDRAGGVAPTPHPADLSRH